MELFWPTIERALLGAFKNATGNKAEVLLKKDSAVRIKEGLDVIVSSGASERVVYKWNGLQWWMCPGGPQKTGSYLDQKVNHSVAAEWAERLKLSKAWDLCCFEGGFGLHLAKKGLKVIGVDQSELALQIADQNAHQNKVSDLMSFEKADIFEWIKMQSSTTDMIVLDPPSFLKDSKAKLGALKGFKELNLRSMKALKPGGVLVSCACSHHVSKTDYEQMLKSAAHDSRKEFNVLEVLGPTPDHAPLLNFPEGTYLQAWFLRML